MRAWITTQGVVAYIFAALLALGLIGILITARAYKRLTKEADLMGNSNNRLLKYIKLKFSSYYKLGMRPQDTMALTKHYMYKYRVGFLSLHAWENVGRVMICGLILLTAGDVFWKLVNNGAMTDIRMTVCAGFIGAAAIYFVHRLFDFKNRQEVLLWHIMDYLENFLKNKIESGKDLEKFSQEYEEKMQQEDAAVAAAKVQKEKPLVRAEVSHEFRPQKPMTANDRIDAKVVEDVLKEFLN